MIRKILSLYLILSLILTFLPISAMATEGILTEDEYSVTESAQCTCGAQADADGMIVHTESCPLYEAPAVENPPAEDGCTCGAQADADGMTVHTESCPLYEAPAVEKLPVEDGCTCGAQADADGVTVHTEGCPLYEVPAEEEPALEQLPAASLGQAVPSLSPMGEGALLMDAEHTPGDHTGWMELTSDIIQSGELASGSYYLADNLNAGTTQIKVTGEVTLCLNGRTFTSSAEDGIFRVGKNGVLNIYDCKGNGGISASTIQNPIFLVSGGACNLFGGTLQSNRTAVVIDKDGTDYTGGTFTMYGGTVRSNSSVNNYQGIKINAGLTDTSVSIYGGTIASPRYGINAASGTVTLSGDLDISGNEAGIYLQNDAKILPEEPQSGSVGVAMDSPGVFTTGSGASCRQYFYSQNGTYEVQVSDSELELGEAGNHSHAVGDSEGTKTFIPLSSLNTGLSAGSYYLSRSLTATGNITISSGTVDLCLNGYTLDMGSHTITVGSNATLNICDCGSGGAITGTTGSSGSSLISVNGGTLNMYSGEIALTYTGSGDIQTIELSNNSTAGFTGGTVKLTTSNTAMSGSRRATTVYQNGGAVTVGGTAVLSLQLVKSLSEAGYGALCVTGGGSLTVTGGTLEAFVKSEPTFAVYLGTTGGSEEGGSATISGGTIGYLNVGGAKGSVNISGGHVDYIQNQGRLTMTGGSVGDATAAWGNNGVIWNQGTANLSGDVVITASQNGGIGVSTENAGSSLTLSGNAAINADIGVRVGNGGSAPTIGDGVTITAAQYGVVGSAILTGAPSISGSTADLYIYASKNIASANGALVDATGYTGTEVLTVQEGSFPDAHQSGYAGYAIKVSDASAGEFTLTNGDGNFSYRNDNNTLRLYNSYVHPICGDGDCGEHGDISWQAWTPTDSGGTLSEGDYYLTKDITLTGDASQIQITGTVNLCLNGHTITGDANNGIFRIGRGGQLNICDCGTDGTIAVNGEHNPIVLHSGGVCSLYSGTLSSGITAVVINSDGAGNQTGGTFTMYGGRVESTSNAKQGIYVYDGLSDAKVNLYGGTVSGNYAVNAGSGTVTLSGSPNLAGDTADIYLPNSAGKVAVDGNLTGTFSVSMAVPGVFTGPGMADYQDSFTSANSGFDVMVTGGGALMLSDGYTVTFSLGVAEGNPPASQTVEKGGKVPDPGTPIWVGHTFAGWYHDNSLWDFNDEVTTDLTLTARWITDPTVTVSGGGELTYGTGGTLTAGVTPADGQNYTYQWYSNTTNSNTGGMRIDGATDVSYSIPGTADRGTYYYYCTVTARINGSDASVSGTSDAVTVTVSAKAYGENSDITIEKIDDQTYTGNALQPKPVIKDGDKTLVEGVDYTLDYSDNTAAGTGKVTITFTGNYSGTAEKTFLIDYANLPTGTDNSDIFGNNYTETSTVWSNSESGVTFKPMNGWTVSQTPDGTYSDSVTFTQEGEHTKPVYVKKDNAIYEIEVSYKLDNTEPMVEYINAPADNAPWTDENVTVSFDASDAANGSGVASVTVSKDGGTAQTITSSSGNYSFTATENGTYTVTVTDGAGNQTQQTIEINNIDKTQPTLSVSGGMESGKELALTVSGSSAGGSGVSVTVKKPDGTTETISGNYTITSAGTYTVTAATGAGQTKTEAITVHSVTIGGDPQLVVDGGKVTVPNAPAQDGYTFDGWYTGGTKWDFEVGQVTSNLALTAKWTLNKPTVSLTADKNTATYNGGDTVITLTTTATHTAGVTYTYEWYKGETKLAATGATLTLANVADTGSYTVKVTASDNSGLTSEAISNEVTVTIHKSTPNYTIPTGLTATYGDKLSSVTLTGGWTWDSPNDFVGSAGERSHAATFTPADTDNYEIVKQTVTITVNKKVLTPTVGTVNDKVYDGTTVATGTVTLEGAVLGEKPAATGTFTFDSAGVGTDKTVTISVALSGDWDDNYELFETELTTTADITPKIVGLTWSGYENLVYDGEPVSVTATAIGLVSGDTCVVEVSGGAEAAAGSYTATAISLDNDNYQLPATGTTQPYTIGQADGTASVTMDGWTYGDTPKVPVPVSDTNGTGSVTYRYTGTTNGGAAYDSADVPAAAGAYTVTATFAATQNHKSVTATADFTIAKKPITGTWQGLNQVYDGSTADVGIILTGLAAGDEDKTATITSDTDMTSAGSHSLAASLDNYEITPATATLVIQKKPITVTVTDNAVTAGDKPKVNIPDLAESDYEMIYKDQEGNVVTNPTQPGTYEVWVEITDPNYRHPDGSSEKQVGTFTVTSGTPTLYTVTFDGNGASGTMADLKVAGGSVLTLPECSYTKAGSLFTGWLYGGKVYQPGDQAASAYSNMIFTAQWQQTTGSVSGVVDQSGAPVKGAVVSLWLGANKLAETSTDADGIYRFADLLPGIYNLVVSRGEQTVTIMVKISGTDEVRNFTLPAGLTNSVVEVTPGSPNIVVGQLDTVFENTDDKVYTETDQAHVNSGGKVELTFTVDEQQENQVGAETVKDLQSLGGSNLSLFLECTLEKEVYDSNNQKVEAASGTITQSSVLLEVRLPLPAELQDRYGYTVSRIHGGVAQTVPQGESSKNDDGEYFTVSQDKTVIILHVRNFSTYAVGYRNAPSSGGATTTYPPVLDESENGSFTLSPSRPAKGQTVTISPKPDEGFRVESITIIDRNGNEVTVTPNADGTYTFIQPNGSVTITVTFREHTSVTECPRDESCPMAAFTDLSLDAWYHNGVHYCLGNGLMAGTGETVFSPDQSTTRGMIATILWRLEGSPIEDGPMDYSDVKPGDWYGQAVVWADSAGVVAGYGNGKFGPDDSITREQMAVMLWRYAGSPDADGSLSSFMDGDQTSDWAQQAMIWAVDQGLITGTGNNLLDPQGLATRAQAATILMQLAEEMAS